MSSQLPSAAVSLCHRLAAEPEVTRIQATLRQVVVLPIRLYRLVLSPLLPRACRFEPTCSEYSLEAVVLHGVPRGVRLAVRRILRCHPWSEAGVDEVPTTLR